MFTAGLFSFLTRLRTFFPVMPPRYLFHFSFPPYARSTDLWRTTISPFYLAIRRLDSTYFTSLRIAAESGSQLELAARTIRLFLFSLSLVSVQYSFTGFQNSLPAAFNGPESFYAFHLAELHYLLSWLWLLQWNFSKLFQQ